MYWKRRRNLAETPKRTLPLISPVRHDWFPLRPIPSSTLPSFPLIPIRALNSSRRRITTPSRLRSGPRAGTCSKSRSLFPSESHARLIIDPRIRRIDRQQGGPCSPTERRQNETRADRALNGPEVPSNKFPGANPPRVERYFRATLPLFRRNHLTLVSMLRNAGIEGETEGGAAMSAPTRKLAEF